MLFVGIPSVLQAASSAIQGAKRESGLISICHRCELRACNVPAALRTALLHIASWGKRRCPGGGVYMDEEEKKWRESFVGLRVALPDYQGGGHGVIKAVVGQVVHVVVQGDKGETIVYSHLDELEEVKEEK